MEQFIVASSKPWNKEIIQFYFKRKQFDYYKEEMRDPPHSRSLKHIEVLAQHRGFSVGVEMAEAFEIYRIIN